VSRVYVINPEERPSSNWINAAASDDPIHRPDAGLRIMEADIVGWLSGRVVRMNIYGNTAVPLIRASDRERPIRTERWQVFEDKQLGAWVAWVMMPNDDRRARRETAAHRFELLVAGTMIFVGAVMAVLILIVLPQCTGEF
jgi:hypothetical protein